MYLIKLLDKDSNILKEIEFPHHSWKELNRFLSMVFSSMPQFHHADIISNEGTKVVHYRGFQNV